MIRFIDNSFDSGNNFGGGFNENQFGGGPGRGFNDFGGFGGFNFPNFGGGGSGGGGGFGGQLGLPSFTNGAIGSGLSTGALITPTRTETVIVQPEPTPTNPIPTPIEVVVPVPDPPKDPNPTAIQTQIDAAASTLANDIVKQLVEQANPTVGGRIFTRFEPINDIVENQKVFLTTGLFSNTTNGVSTNQATMSVLYTGSVERFVTPSVYKNNDLRVSLIGYCANISLAYVK